MEHQNLYQQLKQKSCYTANFESSNKSYTVMKADVTPN